MMRALIKKYSFFVSAFEHLMLGQKDRDVLRWKFSEKGTILLKNILSERLTTSRDLRELYDKRSEIAHGEKTLYDYSLTSKAQRYVRNLIIQLLDLIDEYDLKTVAPTKGQTGKSLVEYVESIIYSDSFSK